MYLNTMSRSLGALSPVRRPPVILPPKRPPKCVPRCYQDASGRTVCVDCSPPMHGLGTITACADAGTGLLIDCWRTAEQRGLGIALDQSQLDKLSTAYQRFQRPNSLAGWVFQNGRMTWQPSGLGDDAPPDPLAIARMQPTKLPSSLLTYNPVIPTVSVETLLAAAQLPNAPTIVKQAAAKLQSTPALAASVGAGTGSWFTEQMISGIPNYLLLAGGGLLLVLAMRGRR